MVSALDPCVMAVTDSWQQGFQSVVLPGGFLFKTAALLWADADDLRLR